MGKLDRFLVVTQLLYNIIPMLQEFLSSLRKPKDIEDEPKKEKLIPPNWDE